MACFKLQYYVFMCYRFVLDIQTPSSRRPFHTPYSNSDVGIGRGLVARALSCGRLSWKRVPHERAEQRGSAQGCARKSWRLSGQLAFRREGLDCLDLRLLRRAPVRAAHQALLGRARVALEALQPAAAGQT